MACNLKLDMLQRKANANVNLTLVKNCLTSLTKQITRYMWWIWSMTAMVRRARRSCHLAADWSRPSIRKYHSRQRLNNLITSFWTIKRAVQGVKILIKCGVLVKLIVFYSNRRKRKSRTLWWCLSTLRKKFQSKRNLNPCPETVQSNLKIWYSNP